MPVISLNEIEIRKPLPGFKGQFIHTDKITIAFFEIEQGAELPEHSHHHEQISTIIEGRFELNLGGETIIQEPGKVTVIPSNIPHSGKALTFCKVIDVFCPVREDYKK